MMKTWTKITIITGITAVVGVGAILGFKHYYEENHSYKNYISNSTNTPSSTNTTVESNGETNATSPTYPSFIDVDGKVMELTSDTIIVDVPLQGEKSFTIDQNTKMESFLHPIEEGSLVDIEANGSIAYKIEAEKTIDAHGKIVAITDTMVTIHYNGIEQSFNKASNFRIDSDGYVGALEGLPAEFSLNENFEMIDLEIDIED